jgi:hypothetical protein
MSEAEAIHRRLAGETTGQAQDESAFQRFLRLGSDSDAEERRGEIILVTARWVLIVVGIVLALNAPPSLVSLQVSIGGMLILAAVNFTLHTNLVMKHPASRTILSWTSAGDVVAISAIIAITGGYNAYAFVFFYPAILAFSLALPLRVTAYLTVTIVGLYATVVVLVSADDLQDQPQVIVSTLIVRLLTFVAVMAAANMYRWVEYRRLNDEKPGSISTSSSPRPSAGQTSAPVAETGFVS